MDDPSKCTVCGVSLLYQIVHYQKDADGDFHYYVVCDCGQRRYLSKADIELNPHVKVDHGN